MKIKKEIQLAVINDYLNTNLKVYEIANKYDLSRQSIRHIILENNLKLKDRKISLTTINGIISDYLNNLTNKEISKKYNLNRCVVQQILKKNNIKLKPSSETSRKHKLINEKYFDVIDTEEKAYVLGLLYADGYINKNGFEISLVEIDKEILEKLSTIFYDKIILGYRKEKKYISGSKYLSKPQYRLTITSTKMKNDLIKHGCVQAKTFKIRLPKLEDNLYKHFIRGYFDGDGCVCIPKKRPQNITVTITSNTKFCDEIAEYITNIVKINMKSCIRYNDVGVVRLTGRKQVVKFMNWLYDVSNIHLKRKYEKYQNFLLTQNN